ncbi:MAG TPA: hypothetical protein VIV40_04775 [Kofleriaceae bacterium]
MLERHRSTVIASHERRDPSERDIRDVRMPDRDVMDIAPHQRHAAIETDRAEVNAFGEVDIAQLHVAEAYARDIEVCVAKAALDEPRPDSLLDDDREQEVTDPSSDGEREKYLGSQTEHHVV